MIRRWHFFTGLHLREPNGIALTIWWDASEYGPALHHIDHFWAPGPGAVPGPRFLFGHNNNSVSGHPVTASELLCEDGDLIGGSILICRRDDRYYDPFSAPSPETLLEQKVVTLMPGMPVAVMPPGPGTAWYWEHLS